jgi:hypothetical protein
LKAFCSRRPTFWGRPQKPFKPCAEFCYLFVAHNTTEGYEMPNINNLDVETYVRLLISEKLTHESDDFEKPEMSPEKEKQHKKLTRKPQTRQD